MTTSLIVSIRWPTSSAGWRDSV